MSDSPISAATARRSGRRPSTGSPPKACAIRVFTPPPCVRRRARRCSPGATIIRSTQCPIVPVAVIGSEEQYPSIADLKKIGAAFGMPALPLIPQLFVGMLLPLPAKYRIYFGEPLRFSGDPDDEDAVIDEKVWVVQQTVQSMVNRGLKERKAIFW
jgi:1-acyl-sn-glycerol-3-phosphate acyltransferase